MRYWMLAAVIGLGASTVLAENEFVESKVTIRVVDQSGTPVTNALVSANSYSHPRSVDGVTDTNGVFEYSDRIGGGLSCFVKKDGYYETGGEIWGGPKQWNDHPRSPFTVVLKKIVNPSPLIFRQVVAHPPRLGEPIAFDLAAGDWVAPDGKGRMPDIWFKSVKRMTSRSDFDFTVTVTFSNEMDGIQEFKALDSRSVYLASDLMPPQEAPLNGYTNRLIAFVQMHPKTVPAESWTENRNYIYRIRARKNEKGELVEANVGWLRGDIRVGPTLDKNGVIMFNYYYNPDPKSRSLESK